MRVSYVSTGSLNFFHQQYLHPGSLTARPWKWMVGRIFSFRDGTVTFQGLLLCFRWVKVLAQPIEAESWFHSKKRKEIGFGSDKRTPYSLFTPMGFESLHHYFHYITIPTLVITHDGNTKKPYQKKRLSKPQAFLGKIFGFSQNPQYFSVFCIFWGGQVCERLPPGSVELEMIYGMDQFVDYTPEN